MESRRLSKEPRPVQNWRKVVPKYIAAIGVFVGTCGATYQAADANVFQVHAQRLGVNQLKVIPEPENVVPDVVPVVQTVQTVPNPYGLDPFFACVAWRESRDQPQVVNTSSGAGGLFQFLPSTWASVGYAGAPQDAPVATQIEAAYKLKSIMGTSPWAGGGYECPTIR